MQLRKDDEGTYKCKAQNVAGERISKDAYLTVQGILLLHCICVHCLEIVNSYANSDAQYSLLESNTISFLAPNSIDSEWKAYQVCVHFPHSNYSDLS